MISKSDFQILASICARADLAKDDGRPWSTSDWITILHTKLCPFKDGFYSENFNYWIKQYKEELKKHPNVKL